MMNVRRKIIMSIPFEFSVKGAACIEPMELQHDAKRGKVRTSEMLQLLGL